MPSRKITWSSEAERTYAQNLAHLKKRWGLKVLFDFLDTTETALDNIAENPSVNKVSNQYDYVRVCVLHKAISVYYSYNDKEIFLITFWNNYQNPDSLVL